MNAAIGLVRVAKCGMFMLYFCAVLGECVSNGCHQLTFVVACAEALLRGYTVSLFSCIAPLQGASKVDRCTVDCLELVVCY